MSCARRAIAFGRWSITQRRVPKRHPEALPRYRLLRRDPAAPSPSGLSEEVARSLSRSRFISRQVMQFDVAGTAANLGCGNTPHLVLRGKFSPALLQLIARCFLTPDASIRGSGPSKTAAIVWPLTLLLAPSLDTAQTMSLSRYRSSSGCGSPCCSPISPRRWRRAAARRRPMHCGKRARAAQGEAPDHARCRIKSSTSSCMGRGASARRHRAG